MTLRKNYNFRPPPPPVSHSVKKRITPLKNDGTIRITPLPNKVTFIELEKKNHKFSSYLRRHVNCYFLLDMHTLFSIL